MACGRCRADLPGVPHRMITTTAPPRDRSGPCAKPPLDVTPGAPLPYRVSASRKFSSTNDDGVDG